MVSSAGPGLRIVLSPPRLDRITERHVTVVTLDEVTRRAVWRMRRVASSSEAAVETLAWEPHDDTTPGWYPQGVTGSHEPGACEARARPPTGAHLLVGWYAPGRARRDGARVSVVDRDSLAYGHVLLARPVTVAGRTAARLLPVATHAGGLAWVGPYLYVASTRHGVDVFAWTHLIRVARGTMRAADRLAYEHVLVSVGRLEAVGRDHGSRLRTSFLSLADDADGRWLVCGEYGRVGQSQRLWRYRLDPDRHLPVVGHDGVARPHDLRDVGVPRMQGAVISSSRWALSTSQGRGNPGDLLVGPFEDWARHRGLLPTGPEDLTLDADDTVWTPTEWPGSRRLVRIALPAAGISPPRPPASDAAPS